MRRCRREWRSWLRRSFRALAGPAIIALLALAGCGGSGTASDVSVPMIAPARVFALAGFQPAGVAAAGRPATISFTVQLPDGQPLTHYKTGSGPHTGVHLIIVRDDLAYIIHRHPPVGPGGRLRETVTFPAPGTYRVLVDVYPNLPSGQANFQLFQTIHVAGAYRARAPPPFRAEQTIDGYRFRMPLPPVLHAIQPTFVDVSVTNLGGRPATFTPWYGALAHAIFFRQGSLDYFHTHVCGAGAPNCTSVLGASRVSGTATGPGHLKLGVLLPAAGTWRLFLQLNPGSRVLTVPYTLKVMP